MALQIEQNYPAKWPEISKVLTAEWGPEQMPYGMVEFAIKDPSGYLLSFGQPVPVRPSPTLQGPGPDDFGHEGTESNIKSNTTNQGARQDRGA